MSTRILKVLSVVVILSVFLAACTSATATQPAATQTPVIQIVEGTPQVVIVTPTPGPEAVTFERSETLYTGGTQWGPPTGFNPWNLGNYAMGTFGLCYEPLFIYDPLADEFTPWLAESGEWTSDTVYQVKVRQGVTGSDGTPFTAADVKATYDIAKEAPASIR